MRLLHVSAFIFLALAVSSCSSERERGTNATRPSCSLAICPVVCECDLSFACDLDCGGCDPECGLCRSEQVACVAPRDAGPPGADSGPGSLPDSGVTPPDAGPCEFPASQGLSMPCCVGLGVDACGAGLFCAAFDGRTQPTCYTERSRLDLETCTEDRHCVSGSCNAQAGQCRSTPNQSCDVNVGCAAANGSRYLCDPTETPPRCEVADGRPGSVCESPTDCANNSCVNNHCLLGVGDTCSQPSDCASGYCFDRRCICSPFDPSSCGANETCAPGGCIPSGTSPAGAACSGPGECQAPFLCVGPSQKELACLVPCDEMHVCTDANAQCFPLESPDFPWGICFVGG